VGRAAFLTTTAGEATAGKERRKSAKYDEKKIRQIFQLKIKSTGNTMRIGKKLKG
jgi:hypothetical protein